MARNKGVSVYISYLLRHNPEDSGLEMDRHGWVSTAALIDGVNRKGTYRLNLASLEEIVAQDSKGRFRFSPDRAKIKACQGHSIKWVEPELEMLMPPKYLYHGTTTAAAEKIKASGAIRKMSRHAVHMQEDPAKAWQSAIRWRLTPVILKIDAEGMHRSGFTFGKTENGVWCTEQVPAAYIVGEIFQDP